MAQIFDIEQSAQLLPFLTDLAKLVSWDGAPSRQVLGALLAPSGLNTSRAVDALELWALLMDRARWMCHSSPRVEQVISDGLEVLGVPKALAIEAAAITCSSLRGRSTLQSGWDVQDWLSTVEPPSSPSRHLRDHDEGILRLRGRFASPQVTALQVAGRLGLGNLCNVVALDRQHAIVVSNEGIVVLNLLESKALWEIDATATSAAVSSDWHLLTIAEGASITLFDMSTGAALGQLHGHTGTVIDLTFSTDSRLLASAGCDDMVRLWDVPSGKERHAIGHSSGREWRGHCLGFGPNSKTLVMGAWVCIHVCDVATGGVIESLWADTDHEQRFCSMAVSPAGGLLAVAELVPLTGVEQPINLYSLNNRGWLGRWLGSLPGHRDRINGMAFDPDGRVLATASEDQTIRLWDTEKLSQICRLRGHTAGVGTMSFSSDGQVLASGGQDQLVCSWNWEDKRGLSQSQFSAGEGSVSQLALNHNGSVLATGSQCGEVKLWNLSSGRLLRTLSESDADKSSIVMAFAMKFSPDGKLLAVGRNAYSLSQRCQNGLRIWDVTTGQMVNSFPEQSWVVRSLAFANDSSRLIVGCPDGVRQYKLGGWLGPRWGWFWQSKYVGRWGDCLDFSALAGLVAAVVDYGVYLLQASTGALLRRLCTDKEPIKSIRFSPDGRSLAIGHTDGAVRVVQVSSGQELAELTGHQGAVHNVAFGSFGTTIISAGVDDTVRWWDVAGEREIRRIDGHGSAAMAVSGDLCRLATSRLSGSVRVWTSIL